MTQPKRPKRREPRSRKKPATHPVEECLIIGPFGNELCVPPDAAAERANFLENHIANALAPLGLRAAYIKREHGSGWSLTTLRERLGRDRLTVAILDDYRACPVYELAVRHALCLAVIPVIERPPDGHHKSQWNFPDIDYVFYEPIDLAKKWTKKATRKFYTDLRGRANAVLARPWTEAFATVFQQRVGGAIMGFIFDQKVIELKRTASELTLFSHSLAVDHLIHDDQPISAEVGKRLAAQPEAISGQLLFASIALKGIVESAHLQHLEDRRRDCIAICEALRALTEKIAAVAQRMHSSTMPPTFPSTRQPPTRSELQHMIAEIQTTITQLRENIRALHRHGRI